MSSWLEQLALNKTVRLVLMQVAPDQFKNAVPPAKFEIKWDA